MRKTIRGIVVVMSALLVAVLTVAAAVFIKYDYNFSEWSACERAGTVFAVAVLAIVAAGVAASLTESSEDGDDNE
jgi:hypothetical protein